jgi:hypothetical protein
MEFFLKIIPEKKSMWHKITQCHTQRNLWQQAKKQQHKKIKIKTKKTKQNQRMSNRHKSVMAT